MKLPLVKKLLALKPSQRRVVSRFASDGEFRAAAIKLLQARGEGVGLDPNNFEAWLELTLKFLPLILSLFA